MLNADQLKTIKSHKAYNLNVATREQADVSLIKSKQNGTFIVADLAAVSFNGEGLHLTECLQKLEQTGNIWFCPEL